MAKFSDSQYTSKIDVMIFSKELKITLLKIKGMMVNIFDYSFFT